MSNKITDQVMYIVNTLETGHLCDGEEVTGWDYLEDVLDVEWILNSDGSYKGARVLVAFGGPNIWIDTATNYVEGYWWGDKFEARYDDAIEFGEAVKEWAMCKGIGVAA